jgi:hypothetical protein
MQINCADVNIVGSIDDVLFELINQGSTDCQFFFSNLGSNTINYHFQQLVSGSWVDISSTTGPDDAYDNQVLTGTLMSAETRSIHLSGVANPQVRVMGNASGGATLWFQVSRFAVRGAGGKLPILNF